MCRRIYTYHTTVRDETAQVESAVAVLGSLECLLDARSLAELSILDGLVDAHDVLPDDTASANVQVADFRVAHEALGQTNGEGRSLELSVAGGALGEGVHDGGLRVGDGVSILGGVGGGYSPTVNDDCKCAEVLESTRKARGISGQGTRLEGSPAGRGSCWGCCAVPQERALRWPALVPPPAPAPAPASASASASASCSRRPLWAVDREGPTCW